MTELRMIPLDQLHPSSDNPRTDVGDVTELAASITAVGILEPLIATPNGKGFEVLAGHRRLAGAKVAGVDQVPVIIREDLDDKARAEIMLIENLQRTDLSPLEEARTYKRLVDLGVAQRDLAERIGRSQSHVSKRLALLELPEVAQKKLDSGGITIDEARELLKLKDHPKRIATAVKSRNLSWEINNQLREVDSIEKKAKLKADLKKKGWVQVKAPKDTWPPEKHDWRPLDTSPYPSQGSLQLDLAAHRKEPCHGAYVADRYGDVKLVEVCVDPGRHKAKGESALKAPVAKRREKSSWEIKEDNKRKAVKAAAKRRTEFLQTAITGRIPRAEATRLIAEQLIGTTHSARDRQEVACEILGLQGKKHQWAGFDFATPLKGYAAKGDAERLRAAFAVALAGCELDARSPHHDWHSESVTSLYKIIGELGYAFDDFETKQLRPKKKATPKKRGTKAGAASPAQEAASSTKSEFGQPPELTDEQLADAELGELQKADAEAGARSCIDCGCTDQYGCPGGCSWVDTEGEVDICSNCALGDRLVPNAGDVADLEAAAV
jgi:ParB family transcriptional regulator, chromosome partitioning protein